MNIGYLICKYLWEKQWVIPRHLRFIYKKIAREGAAPNFPFSVDFYGLEYRGNLQSVVDFEVYYFGAFEKPLLYFLRDCVTAQSTDNGCFLDIGANVGHHSLFLSMYSKHVHSFEPYRLVIKKLEEHIEINKLKNITIHPIGLGIGNAMLPFYAPTGRNLGLGSFQSSAISSGNQYVGELQVVNGDEYIKQKRITNIDLIKIDVEGFEKLVIGGLNGTLRKNRPVLVMEITYGNDISFRSKEELLRILPPNYKLFTFKTRKKDGSKAKRRNRRSGSYEIIPFDFKYQSGQDDIIACPEEKVLSLPLRGE